MNIVKELRKKYGIQQKELALIIGVAQPTVSEWETGKKDPSGERLKKLAEYFQTDELAILGKGTGNRIKLNEETQIVCGGMERMSKEQREQVLAILRAVYMDKPDLFKT